MRTLAGDPRHPADSPERTQTLGRIAGILFLAGALASAPATLLLANPDPAWYVHLINLLAAVSGGVCLLLPWRRIDARWLHALPIVAVGEIVLSVSALGIHGEVNLWFFLLVAVFTGYAFRRRLHVAAHMTLVGIGFVGVAATAPDTDADALVGALVGIPTLWVAAGVVAWLREGVEAREAAMSALAAQREMEARTDALTGLLNRRALMDALEFAVAEGAPHRTFALFDLDGFKAYNDRFGHPAGDTLLERLGQRLEAELGEAGRAFRLGGDEFCVLANVSGRAAEPFLARCAEALSDAVTGVVVEASYGSAQLPDEAASATEALSIADTRMYEAKERRSAAMAKDSLAARRHERRRGSRIVTEAPWSIEASTAPESPSPPAEPIPLRPAR